MTLDQGKKTPAGEFAVCPRPSQLTQNEFLSSAYALQEQIEDMSIDPGDLQAVADELRSVADEIRQLGEEQEDKIGNMPDSLQEGSTAEMMRGRNEACEEVAGELESVRHAGGTPPREGFIVEGGIEHGSGRQLWGRARSTAIVDVLKVRTCS